MQDGIGSSPSLLREGLAAGRTGTAGVGGAVGGALELCSPGFGASLSHVLVGDLGRAARLSSGLRGTGLIMPSQGAVAEVEQNDVSAIREAHVPCPSLCPGKCR